MRRVLLALLVAAAPARADTGPHKEGDYGGVTPGETVKPDKPPKPKRPPPKGTLTWVGFEAKDGGAQVFFQSVAAFEITQHLEGATLVVHLALKQLGHNTWRQVDTRFFDNPLSGIVAKTVGARGGKGGHPAGIEARIAFKNPKDAREGSVRATSEPDGMYYVYLTFPEGTDKPAPAPAPAEPEADPDATPKAPPKKK